MARATAGDGPSNAWTLDGWFSLVAEQVMPEVLVVVPAGVPARVAAEPGAGG